jgi:transcriptional regulator with XRE-family HTH domain
MSLTGKQKASLQTFYNEVFGDEHQDGFAGDLAGAKFATFSPRKISDFDQIISTNLKRLRIEHNYSRPFMAKKLGVCVNQYYKYETGKSRLSGGFLRACSDILGISIADFFYHASDNFYFEIIANELSTHKVTPYEKESLAFINQTFLRLNTEKREFFINLLRTFAKELKKIDTYEDLTN